ncbi:hypothetical protein [Alkalinema sp. FACHB-956]|uniref:hypothetical protein n=1 Tax=Alkalinema sp. FACHB-956 TaxID=2692768 RepID=UPI00168436F5|nr:hypothetical protein [Alkalinema sp. FACHB-956]MBD2329138.1 hypothetical protein [Alkalinema sp. FACHB-956]
MYPQAIVLVDGYTLAIGQHQEQIIFWGRHSRQSCSAYNDAWFIQVLANQALAANYPDFWHCLKQHEPWTPIAYDAFGRSFETELWPIRVDEADHYRDWSLWELIHTQTQQAAQTQQAKGFDELIWRWVPGNYYPDYFMVHSTVLKIMQVARSWVEYRQIPDLAGVEVITEADWIARFGTPIPSNNKFSALQPSNHRLLIPPILQDLEQTAANYLELFTDRAYLYTPDNATQRRDELLNRLYLAGLMNLPLSQELQDQLISYPKLQSCLIRLDRLQKIIHQHCLQQRQSLLVLDWIFFTDIWPQIEAILERALQTLQQADLKAPHSLRLSIGSQSYQLLTTKTLPHSAIQLAAAIPIAAPEDLTDRLADGTPPSYLELLTWAALPNCYWPLEPGAIDWTGREQALLLLGSDPALPQAQQLLACLSCHLGQLWARGDLVTFDRILGMLNLPTTAVQGLRSRCLQLRFGTTHFNYADWCGAPLHKSSSDST